MSESTLTQLPVCQCGHTRASHDEHLRCFGCTGVLPCDAPGVTVRLRTFKRRWRWDLRCRTHGSLRVGGPIDLWEPEAVAIFRREHADCA